MRTQHLHVTSRNRAARATWTTVLLLAPALLSGQSPPAGKTGDGAVVPPAHLSPAYPEHDETSGLIEPDPFPDPLSLRASREGPPEERISGEGHAGEGPEIAATEACEDFYALVETGTAREVANAIDAMDVTTTSRFQANSDCLGNIWALRHRPTLQINASSEDHVVEITAKIQARMPSYDSDSVIEPRKQTLFLVYLGYAGWIYDYCRVNRWCPLTAWAGETAYDKEPGSTAGDALAGALGAFIDHEDFVSVGEGPHHAEAVYRWERAARFWRFQAHVLRAATKSFEHPLGKEDSARDVLGYMRDLLYYGHRASNFGAKYGEDTDLFNAVLNYATRKDLVGLQVYRIQQQLAMELGASAATGTPRTTPASFQPWRR